MHDSIVKEENPLWRAYQELHTIRSNTKKLHKDMALAMAEQNRLLEIQALVRKLPQGWPESVGDETLAILNQLRSLS